MGGKVLVLLVLQQNTQVTAGGPLFWDTFVRNLAVVFDNVFNY